MKKRNLAIMFFCVYSFFLYADEEKIEPPRRHVFIEVVSSNIIQAIVSLHDDIVQTRSGGHFVSTNTFLNLFGFNENTFGERWILEGWAGDSSQKEILYDTHEAFTEAVARREKARAIKARIPAEKFRQMLQSGDPEEREFAREISMLTWQVGGGSRRSVNRAREISRERNIPIRNRIPLDLERSRAKNGEPIRYLQLRIEPLDAYEPDEHMWGSTNTLEALQSNIIDLKAGK